MKRFVLPTLIGILVSLAIACFIENGPLFMLASIVCTAGISLTVWLPLWWLVGRLILFIAGKREQTRPKEAIPVGQEQKTLINYVAKEVAKGVKSREEIIHLLHQHGWNDNEIQHAFRTIVS